MTIDHIKIEKTCLIKTAGHFTFARELSGLKKEASSTPETALSFPIPTIYFC